MISFLSLQTLNSVPTLTHFGPLPSSGNYAKYYFQYGAHVPEGRVLVVCGDTLIDISGRSSSATLKPLVRKLLTRTTVDMLTCQYHYVPHAIEHSHEIPETPKGPSDVTGISSFNVKCYVDNLVAAASADVEGHGTYDIDATSAITFTFVTRRVGVHEDLRFENALTMNTGTKRIQIMVVDA